MSHKYIRAEIAAVYGCGFSSLIGTEPALANPNFGPRQFSQFQRQKSKKKTLQEMSFHAGCCDMIAIIKTKCSFLPYYCSFSLIVSALSYVLASLYAHFFLTKYEVNDRVDPQKLV